MKKLYTILLAASVAVSASAATAKVERTAFATPSALVQVKELATKAAPIQATTLKAHPAKAKATAAATATAPTTIDEITGVYEYSMYSYGVQSELNGVTTIVAGEGENEIILKGFRYTDVDLKATVDFTAKTVTVPAQNPIDEEGFVVTMCKGTVTSDNKLAYDITGDVVFTIGEDGSLAANDYMAFVRNQNTLMEWMEDILVAKTDKYNTKVEFSEQNVDDEGYFLDTYTEYVAYVNSELQQDVTIGTEELGECVVLNNFLFSTNSAITKVNPIYVQIERDTHTVFIDWWYWFTATLSGETYNPVICGVVNNYYDAIEGTFSGNTVSWTGQWFCRDMDKKATFGSYKDCTLTFLTYNLEDNLGGVSDVVVDNANAPVEYYNLQGVRISEPAAGQVVIRRQGTDVQKLFVK